MKLVWSEPALADIESIRDYIRRDSEFYADSKVRASSSWPSSTRRDWTQKETKPWEAT